MTAPALPVVEPTIHEGVMEVLQKHNCVEEFWQRVALARECVPELRRLDVRLVHDPDEEGSMWARITAIVPADTSWQRCMALSHYYIDEAVDRRFPSRVLFSFVLQVVPEPE